MGSSASSSLRVAGERARDRHALLLAARELRRHVLHARGQADEFQRVGDALVAFRGLHAAVAQRHVDVVVDVEVGHQVEALEDEADLLVAQVRARVVGEAVTSDAVELVAAGVEGLEQARDVEERGLARARGPGDRDELAGLHLQREVAQRMRLDQVGAKDLADVRHGKHGDRFLLVTDEDAGRVLEVAHVGEHDGVADLRPLRISISPMAAAPNSTGVRTAASSRTT